MRYIETIMIATPCPLLKTALNQSCGAPNLEQPENDNYFIVNDGKVESRGIGGPWDGEFFDEKCDLNGRVMLLI